MSKSRLVTPFPGRATDHAARISEKVSEAWYGRHGSGDLEVPVSVVSLLAFLTPPRSERNDVAGELIDLSPEEFAEVAHMMWGWFVQARPDLCVRAYPLIDPWVSEDRPMTPETMRAAKAVADAALRADQLALNHAHEDVDLLGTVLTVLRPKSALQGRGQYYTPPDLADVIARMLGAPKAGQSVNDPALGTGGTFRAVAQAMRHEQHDPATASWEGNDVDHLAVACAAVNVVLWRLGRNVLLGVGDTLAADWRARAVAEREAPQAIVKGLTIMKAIADAEMLVQDLLDQAEDG